MILSAGSGRGWERCYPPEPKQRRSRGRRAIDQIEVNPNQPRKVFRLHGTGRAGRVDQGIGCDPADHVRRIGALISSLQVSGVWRAPARPASIDSRDRA